MVKFYGTSANLHKVWDTSIIARIITEVCY